jgi:hypothetical protein
MALDGRCGTLLLLISIAGGHGVRNLGNLASMKMEQAENFRRGILYFLSTVDIDSGLYSDRDNYLLSANLAESLGEPNIGKYISTGKKRRSEDKALKKNKLFKRVVKAAKDLVKKFSKVSGTVAQFSKRAMQEVSKWLAKHIPDIVLVFMRNVVKSLLPLGDMISIGSDLISAVRLGYDAYKASNVAGAIKSGDFQTVFNTIRKQIKYDAIGKVANSVKTALTGALKLAPPVGQIASVIQSVMGFIVRVYYHFRHTYKMDQVLFMARKLYPKATKEAGRGKGYFKDAAQFHKYFTGIVGDMPVIASYVLGNPLTGSYNGFLSAIQECGGCLSEAQLRSNAKVLDNVKGYARSYIQKHSVKLVSADKVTALALSIAQGKDVNLGNFKREFDALKGRE